MWVKIINADPQKWYYREIGEKFFVKDFLDMWMVRKDKKKGLIRFIDKKDAIPTGLYRSPEHHITNKTGEL